MVDPWHTEGIVKDTPEEVEAAARRNVRAFGDRAMIVKMTSVAAADYLLDGGLAGKVDFVYIDALHDEENVRNDINAWWPLVREGGLLMGHDYGRERPPKTQPGTPDWAVKKVVDDWANSLGLKVSARDFTWSVKKAVT